MTRCFQHVRLMGNTWQDPWHGSCLIWTRSCHDPMLPACKIYGKTWQDCCLGSRQIWTRSCHDKVLKLLALIIQPCRQYLSSLNVVRYLRNSTNTLKSEIRQHNMITMKTISEIQHWLSNNIALVRYWHKNSLTKITLIEWCWMRKME